MFVKCSLTKLALFAGRGEFVNKACLGSPRGSVLSRRPSCFTSGPSPHVELTNHTAEPKPLFLSLQQSQNETKSCTATMCKFRHHSRDGVWSPKPGMPKAKQPGITPPLQRMQTSTARDKNHNPSITEWFRFGGTLQTILFQPPCPGQGPLPPAQVAQSPVQPGLEHCQGGGSHSFSGQPGPGPRHPQDNEFLPYI